MKVIFLLVAVLFYKGLDAGQSAAPIQIANTAPVVAVPVDETETTNTGQCKLFAWWWYISFDLLDGNESNDRLRYFIKRDADMAGCDIGQFCQSCGPMTCVLAEKYYACRNLCDHRPKTMHMSACKDVGIAHSIPYFLQLRARKVPIPSSVKEQYKSQKITWNQPFYYPQINKIVNPNWNADTDLNLAKGVPLPFDFPQVSKPGGILPGTPSPISTLTDGKGYDRIRTVQDAAKENAMLQEGILDTQRGYTAGTALAPSNMLTPKYP
jgi:hypothetical protein